MKLLQWDLRWGRNEISATRRRVPDFGGRQSSSRSDGDVAVAGLVHLQAQEVHEAQLTGDPRAAGDGMEAGAFLGRQLARSFGAIDEQESLVVLDRLPRHRVRDPVAESALGERHRGTYRDTRCGNLSGSHARPGVSGERSISRVGAGKSNSISSVLVIGHPNRRVRRSESALMAELQARCFSGVMQVLTGPGHGFSQSTRFDSGRRLEAEHSQVHQQFGDAAVEGRGRNTRGPAGAREVLVRFQQPKKAACSLFM